MQKINGVQVFSALSVCDDDDDDDDCYDQFTRFEQHKYHSFSREWEISSERLFAYNVSSGLNLAAMEGLTDSDVVEDDNIILLEQQNGLLDADRKVMRDVKSYESYAEQCKKDVEVLGDRSSYFKECVSDNVKVVALYDRMPKSSVVRGLLVKGLGNVNMRFPGVTFGSLTREVISKLTVEEYVLSVKINGVRAIMLFYQGDIFLWDRRELGVVFGKYVGSHLNGKIYDVELTCHGEVIVPILLDDMTSIHTNFVLRHRDMVKSISMGVEHEMYCQEYFPLDRMDLVYGQEGVIFYPLNKSYKVGYSNDVFKWKPHGDTGDFLVSNYGHNKCLMSAMYVNKKLESYKIRKICSGDFPGRVGEIVECAYHDGTWVYIQGRMDKTIPNADWIIEAVIKACISGVSFTYLYNYVRRFRCYKQDRILKSLYKFPGSVPYSFVISPAKQLVVYVRRLGDEENDWSYFYKDKVVDLVFI